MCGKRPAVNSDAIPDGIGKVVGALTQEIKPTLIADAQLSVVRWWRPGAYLTSYVHGGGGENAEPKRGLQHQLTSNKWTRTGSDLLRCTL